MKPSDLIFLGDSLTMRHNWSHFNALNMGIDGDTTDGVLARIHLCKDAKTLVLMLGINDILTQTPLEEIKNSYTKILESFDPEQKVFILSVLPVINNSQTRDINQKVQTLNIWLKAQTQKYQYKFIDLYPHFLDNSHLGLKANYSIDGVHLTDEAYIVWENILSEALHTKE